MALTREQQRLLDRHLTVRAGEDLDPPTSTITVTKQQLAFLIEAIEHFHATRCPLEGQGAGCELLSWYEHAGGPTALACPQPCISWRDHLIAHVVPRAFPPPWAQPASHT